MRLTRTGKPDNFYYYVIEDYKNDKGQKKTRTVESLGCARVIREKFGVDDAEQWCREYIAKKNNEIKEFKENNCRSISIKLREDLPKADSSAVYNFGYLILDSLYHSFGMKNICQEIASEHPHLLFDLNDVLRTVLFGRILFPSSEHGLVELHQQKFLVNPKIELQHIYQTMDLLNSNNTMIQDRLYYYTSQSIKRDVSCIYYDCTNFFSEIEVEDCDREGQSEEWYKDHTLRKYGKSKENHPNPIVQMGLFMDSNGMPLGFCINPGSTNEQTTMIPLEKQLLKNFQKADITVCTDCGLSSEKNRKFNTTDENDFLNKYGFEGKRNFVCTQSIKTLPEHLKEWALNTAGWSYRTTDKSGNAVTVNDFNLSTLDDESVYTKYYNIIFFKERTTCEKNRDERLIVTFSLKYKAYLESVRARKLKRANKMIENGTYDQEHENSPKHYISKLHTTENGEYASKQTACIDTDKVNEDTIYEGFYAVATNIFKDEKSSADIAALSSRRWEIEECFRIMKSDLVARPFFHSKDSRIIAHFQTCFMALLLLRGIEYKLAEYHGSKDKYPNGRYTMDQILNALKSMNVFSVENGLAYMPDYNNSQLIEDLLTIFSMKEFTKQIVMKDKMKKIIQSIKKSPTIYKKN